MLPFLLLLTQTPERSRKRAATQVAETQSMFDKFVEDHRITTHDVGEMSVELMTAPLRDEEKERIEIVKKDLDVERQRFTEAAIKLGKERAELEVNYLDCFYSLTPLITIHSGRTP
jgi:hypothetical protein